MAGGAIYDALLVLQSLIASIALVGIAVWKIRRHREDAEGPRGLLLWLSFGLAVLAAAFDWMALTAGRAGHLGLIDLWRNWMLAVSFAAFLAGLFGRGTGKMTLTVGALALMGLSRALMMAFVLQFL